MITLFALSAIMLIDVAFAAPLVLGRNPVSINIGSAIREIYHPPFVQVTMNGQQLTLTQKKRTKSFGRLVVKTKDSVEIFQILAVDSDGIEVSSKLISLGLFSNAQTEAKIEIISPEQPRLKLSPKLKLEAIKNVDKNIFQVILKPEISKLIPGEVLRESLQIEGSGENIQVDVVGIYRG